MLQLRPVAASSDPAHRTAPAAIPLSWIAVPSAVLVAVVALVVWRFEKTAAAFTIGDLGILIAVATAAVSCAWAARTTPQERLAWALLSVAATLWTIGQVIYTYYGLTRNNVYPYPSLADLSYLSYCVPAALALFAFPRAKRRASSWLRGLIDALVIALSVMFISWATVLRNVFEAGGDFDVYRVTGLAYPSVDVLVASLVLALGMRRPAGQRKPWLLMGTGLIVLAITDSLYVHLLNEGQTGLTGTLLSCGWMVAWLLVACAPWVKRSAAKADSHEGAAVLIDLAPYVLFFMVLATSAGFQDTTDLFMRIIGWAILLLIVVRQVMIVHENVTLTRDLETKVKSRTTELAGLASIVQSSSDAIIATDIQGTIRSWNPGAGWIFGYTESEMAGRQLAELVSPDPLDGARQRLEAVLDQVRRGEQVRNFEADWPRADGNNVPVAFTFSPISDADVLQGISVIGQDVTERRAVQEDLEIARSEALESSRLKSQFLATMSHEIRTPMNGVIGLTSLLLETPLDATQRQYAEGVSGAGEALLSVINDILDFSKLEAGKVELDLGVFDPQLLVEDVASLVMVPAHGKRLELVAFCQPGMPQLLVGDAGRIRQILLNLASNAVKFTAEGEVTVTARAVGPVLTDSGGADGGPGRARIRFEVADTGIGLAPESRGAVFESFSQADASTTRRFGGTGLGLAISRRLTEVMGGTIGVDSKLDVGSTFWFEVTLSVATGTNAHGVTLSHEILDRVPVLVVDDNATNLLMLQSQLTSWRMQPTAVDGGQAALTLLRDAAAAGTPFAVAVLDMEMPEIDGLEVARRISADRSLAATRVVMLTSSMSVEASQMRQAGVGEWLTKPVRSSVLYDRLMRLMAPMEVVTPTPAQRSSPKAAGSLGRILVVEDNALNQLVAEGVVTKLGYHVDIVANGAEALNAIARTFYAAVLMDCHMPVMDGFAATEEIRRRGGDDAIPIIAMTAGAMAEDRDRCLAVGMNDYVSKPVNVSAVSEALARWARTSPADAAAATLVDAPPPLERPAGGDRLLDAGRQQLLRELGPDDGWGILPAAVEAFLTDVPQIVAALRLAVASGDARHFGEAVHQLKGAAANIGVIKVFELCQEVKDGGTGRAAPDSALVDRIEAELDRAAPALRDALAPAR